MLAAEAELAVDQFSFALRGRDESWTDYLTRIERDRMGVDLAPGRVPATMLFGVVGDEIVGRVHVRHALTPYLLGIGGHVGYGVRPAHRGRGYATQLLRAGLDLLRELGIPRALVTCDDDNLASAATIERNGGVLENVVPAHGETPKRRYWIDLSSPETAAVAPAWLTGPVADEVPVHQVYGLIFDRGGRIMLQRDNVGRYNLPGGKPEAGESYLATLDREALEESSITVSDATYLGHLLHTHPSPYAQVRLVAGLASLLPNQPDSATGLEYARVLAEPEVAIGLLNWGPHGEAQIRAGVERARELGLIDPVRAGREAAGVVELPDL